MPTNVISAVREIENALALYLPPGGVYELRGLGVRGRAAVSAHFSDLGAMAALAAQWDEQGATGVFFGLNPRKPDLLGTAVAAAKKDVARRLWLGVDSDAQRPTKTNATEREREASWAVLDAARATLTGAGLVGEIVSSSGNGWHGDYPLDLDADDASQELVKAVLAGLQTRCGAELTDEQKATIKRGELLDPPQAVVDKSCHDAPRIWKVPGTTARKGPHSAERPHRKAWLVSGQAWDAATAGRNVTALRALLAGWAWAADLTRGRPTGSLIERARSYLTEMETTICGTASCHDKTFRAAATLVKDFGLSEGEALPLLADWADRGTHRWSEHELRHKLHGAAAKDGPVGRLRDAERNGTAHEIAVPEIPPYRGEGTEGTETASSSSPISPLDKTFALPIPASLLKAPPEAAWLWKGYLARGGITLLTALWKAGKTTLLVHLLRLMEEGGEFCGQTVTPGRVLYVTEEHEGRWAARRDKHAIKDHVEFLVRPFPGKPRAERWMEFLGFMRGIIVQRNYDLLIFDTVANLWPVRDENDASGVQSALMPLHTVLKKEALLLVHHNRKGDGEEATASRGSGALTAFVDTIMELRRYSPEDRADRRRVITSYGRDEETPEEVVVELNEFFEYVVHGSRSDSGRQDLKDTLYDMLPTGPPGLFWKALMDLWPENVAKPNRTKIFDELTKGVDEGRWFREGNGVRGSPHKYWRRAEAGDAAE